MRPSDSPTKPKRYLWLAEFLISCQGMMPAGGRCKNSVLSKPTGTLSWPRWDRLQRRRAQERSRKGQDAGWRPGVELVKAGNDAAIRDLRQAANVEDEIGATSVDFDLIAGLLNIAIGEAESLE
jgi:hypothetical protein